MSAPPKTPLRGWAVLLLTGVVGLLFFLDRNTLATLKTTLGQELGITNQDYSFLVTAFMAPYIAMYFFVGKLVDRHGTRIGVMFFVLAMSVATLLCGLAQNKWQMAGARMLLGMAEAGVMPAVFVAVTAWFPPERRAFAFSVRAPVQSLGPIIAPSFAVAITLALGWRFVFWIPALLGVGVAAVWWFTDTGDAGAPAQRPVTSLREVLMNRTLWGIFAVRILTDPFWFLLQFWQAGYLQESLGVSFANLGKLLWLPPLCESILGLGLAWYSDHLIRSGVKAPRARAWILVGLIALLPCAFILASVPTVSVAIVMLILTQFMSHSWLSGTSLLAAELVEKGRMASVIAVMSALGGISSIAVQAVAGTVVDWFGYSTLFTLSACVYPVATLVIWHCYLRARPQVAAAGASVA